ncbi:hydrogenase formation protein HypD [Mesobacillus zeae]|uniref:Hydrogenase formation protein HypD n=1 Tax=Mesobacillus zeae TaxID=1917180 RepID=A0A398B8Y2_9BACI|nr:hydrogenase formation protein HypD [Mesobacillus zeae]RID84133.1 hydrogenase formation protein HypD [Mesobacillus zeae]
MQELLKQSSNPEILKPLLQAVKEKAAEFISLYGRKPAFMEVCGSHTMALAKSGVKQALREDVSLISGPGCPVCVTDQHSIDSMIALAEGDGRIICTFGDMMKVPGSRQSLMDAKINGKDIRVVYSPVDSIRIAEENPGKEVIFLGIGFETTIPILAILVEEAYKKGLGNFSIWMTTKLVEPILRHLLNCGDVMLDGFLLPGHVSIVLGEEAYSFLPEEYNIGGVISGFEPAELLSGIYKLLDIAITKDTRIINDHPSVVTKSGNVVAKQLMEKYFSLCDEAWRGIGSIPSSGLSIRREFDQFDAKKKFKVDPGEPKKTKCRCGEVIRGLINPTDCVLFGKACNPMKPVGPCMVSAEGSCAAYYQYMRECN